VNIVRNSLLGVAVAALMVLPATAAHATENEIDVTPGNLQGWSVDTDTRTDYRFVDTQQTIGKGSVRFGPISSNPSDKFAIRRAQTIPTGDLQSISFDYYIDPSSSNVSDPITPHRFYLNLYTDSSTNPGTPGFYECRFDYESTITGSGWHTTTITPTTPAVLVRTNPIPAGLACPATSYGQLSSDSQVLSYALNGGDTSTPAGDVGLIGNFDKFVVRTSTRTTTFDFEPGPACSRDGGQTQNGRSGNDNLRGTDGRDRIEGRDGNDVIDGRGGDDCLVGGNGNDRLLGAAGDDEIQGGQGNDMIDGDAGADVISGGQGNDQIKGGAGDDNVDAAAGNDIVDVKNDGVDTVDCGAGNDIVFADKNDTVSNNCETRPGS
jgi:hypothetical protein